MNIWEKKTSHAYLWHKANREAFHCSDAKTCRWTALSLLRKFVSQNHCSIPVEISACDSGTGCIKSTWGSPSQFLWFSKSSQVYLMPHSSSLPALGTANVRFLEVRRLPCRGDPRIIWDTWLTWSRHAVKKLLLDDEDSRQQTFSAACKNKSLTYCLNVQMPKCYHN